MEELKYVIFQLGDEKYGMNLRFINGIEQDYLIIPVPTAPAGIKGIINLRGAVIPVYSLREHFGMNSEITNPEKSLLVTQIAGTTMAYEVDAVTSIEQMEPSGINSMPEVASTDDTFFMEEVLRIGSEIVIAITADKILSDDLKNQVDRIVAETEDQNKE